MPTAGLSRPERQAQLRAALGDDPFLTDEELAGRFGVSVQTVRLDRLALGIPEVRRRVQAVAHRSLQRARLRRTNGPAGQLLDIEPGRRGLSLLEPGAEMVEGDDGSIGSQHLFAQAEALALAVAADGHAAVEVVNVKFKRPVASTERLVAKAVTLRRRADGALVVLVETRAGDEVVLRAKFVVVEAGGSGL